MMQDPLFIETCNDALRAMVNALGGYKKVGPKMRPELTVDEAAQWLRDCLNPDRRAKLDPEWVFWLFRECRHVGFHGGMNYALRDAGYSDAQPIEPEDEASRLQREFLAGVEQFKALGGRLDRIADVLARTNVTPMAGRGR